MKKAVLICASALFIMACSKENNTMDPQGFKKTEQGTSMDHLSQFYELDGEITSVIPEEYELHYPDIPADSVVLYTSPSGELFEIYAFSDLGDIPPHVIGECTKDAKSVRNEGTTTVSCSGSGSQCEVGADCRIIFCDDL